MDGKTALSILREIFTDKKEKKVTIVIEEHSAYRALDAASCQFARDVLPFRKVHTITTVESQREYYLPPDFISIVTKESMRRPVIKYTDSDDNQSLIKQGAYDDFWDNDETDHDKPDEFDIIEESLSLTAVAGDVTSDGVQSNGESTLTDSGADFTGDDLVFPRDIVHNLTNKADGIILSVTSGTALNTAMARDKVEKGWESGDSYRVQPSSRFKLILDYPTATADETITIPYYCLPLPVYSPYTPYGYTDPNDLWAIGYNAAWRILVNEDGNTAAPMQSNMKKGNRLLAMYRMLMINARTAREDRTFYPRINKDLASVL